MNVGPSQWMYDRVCRAEKVWCEINMKNLKNQIQIMVEKKRRAFIANYKA
jgi:hypothetical protein